MSDELHERAIAIVKTQLHVREIPPGSNRHPAIDEYMLANGLEQPPPPKRGHAYCLALQGWSFLGATNDFDRKKFPILASVVPASWSKIPGSPIRIGAHVGRFYARVKKQAPERILEAAKRGALGLWMDDPSDPEESKGHAFMVEDVIVGTPGKILSLEGNTGPGETQPGTDADRNGDGVRAKMRKPSYATCYVWLGDL